MSSSWANVVAGRNTGANNANPNEAASKAQLEDFLRRTNNAGLHAREPTKSSSPPSFSPFPRLTNNAEEPANKTKTKEEEEWELIDENEIKDAQDKDEWTLIGKTAAENAELEKRIAEQDERRVKRRRV
jgi:hypothetical protein